MSSKFMAFENEASTSQIAHLNDTESERMEMNINQYRNYESNMQLPQQQENLDLETSLYRAVDDDNDESDLNADLVEENYGKNEGYRKFIYNNSGQLLPICGGLVLLLGSGIHTVWGIYRIFHHYQTREENSISLRFIIWSWYIGAIISSHCAGYAIAKIQKGHIYLFAGSLMLLSGILLRISGGNTNFYLFAARFIGGCTHGLVYVTILVHASENATKQFREFLVLIIGAVLNYSIMISVLCFFSTDNLQHSSFLNCIGLVGFGICSMLITTKHSTETVPFLLQNNGTEMDALQTISKLNKKPIAARSVHHDFLAMRTVIHTELEQYGPITFWQILHIKNQKSFIFCCYGRLCSVFSFNLPLIVIILLFLRNWIDEPATQTKYLKQNDMVPTEIPVNLNASGIALENRPKRESSLNKINNTVGQTDAKLPEKSKTNMKEKLTEETSDINEKKTKSESNKIGTDGDTATKDKKLLEKDKEPENEKTTNDESKKNEDKNSENEKKPLEKDKEKEKTTNDETKINEDKNSENAKKSDESKKSSSKDDKNPTKTENKSSDKDKKENINKGKTIESENNNKSTSVNDKGNENKNTHLLIFLRNRELTLVLLAWFIFGTLTVSFLYTLNLKHFIYHVAFYLPCVLLLVTGTARSFPSLTGLMHFTLIIYFNYVTIPIDIFGHGMLAEAFPITLKAHSIGSVAALEHFVHIILIGCYMTEWFHDSIIFFMIFVAYLAHEIARNLPQKSNLPLAEARDEYQKINLMFFNEKKVAAQEFI